MKKISIGFIALTSALFVACGGDHKNDENSGSEAKGGVYLGGIARVNEVETFKSLMPISINEINSFHIGSQIYEGLVKYNPNDLTLMPAIAKSWEVAADQKEYTFHLRSNAKFHDDACFPEGKGRMANATDVKYCFDKLCTQDGNNTQYDITFKDRVDGANESYAASKTGKSTPVKGVTVVNDTTLKISLVHPDASFLNILAMPGCYIYPKEAVDKYGAEMRIKTVGTGPFFIENIKEGDVVIMKKNQSYWGVDQHGNKLPYLDGIKWSFIRDKKTEILEFKRGNLDMVYRIPVEMFSELMGKLENANKSENEFNIVSSTALNTNYYGFNLTTNPVFAKKDVRLAFNYAIDRHKIADFTIQGEGTSADYGMVPYTEAFEKEGYPYKELKAYAYDPAKAQELLKQAGYPDGKGFPEINLEINSGGGDRNILIAEVVKSMLDQNLKIKVNINTVPFSEHLDNMQTGKADFFRNAWVADYPDPESFLTLFLSSHIPAVATEKSYVNTTRFRNAKFDSLFMAARVEGDKTKRFKLLGLAEQILLDEAPVMPIFYDENFRLVHKHVRNLPENPMNFIDMTTTYFVHKKEAEKK